MIDEDARMALLRIIESKLGKLRLLCERNAVSGDIIELLNELDELLLQKSADHSVEISAQLSIYPLRQNLLSETIHKALEVLTTFELQLIPGPMSTLVLGEESQLWAGLRNAFSVAASQGEVVMITTISNACPRPNNTDH